jgi:DNA-directed RNA polymerase specialized sigma24 family protein
MEIANDSTHLDSHWLAQLRRRFVEIAARRVPESAVEDVVHDALGIVLAKGAAVAREHGQKEPPLRWSFTVLRNVIGNYYQKRRSHEAIDNHDLPGSAPSPLAALTSAERLRTIRGAVDELATTKPDCARWLWAMAEGAKAGQLARGAHLEEAAFYRRIYRCRQALAEILKGKGVTS